jgi:hypothetical protein
MERIHLLGQEIVANFVVYEFFAKIAGDHKVKVQFTTHKKGQGQWG